MARLRPASLADLLLERSLARRWRSRAIMIRHRSTSRRHLLHVTGPAAGRFGTIIAADGCVPASRCVISLNPASHEKIVVLQEHGGVADRDRLLHEAGTGLDI